MPGGDVPGFSGLAIYADGQRKPASILTWPSGGSYPHDTIQLSSNGDSVYGLDTGISDFTFAKLSLGPDGVHLISRGGVGTGFLVDLKCENDACFTTSGAIIDGKTQTFTGTFALDFGARDFQTPQCVLPDLQRNRVYFLTSSTSGITIMAYDVNSRQLVATFKVPGVLGPVGSFLLWNGDQFACSTGQEVVLLPISVLEQP